VFEEIGLDFRGKGEKDEEEISLSSLF